MNTSRRQITLVAVMLAMLAITALWSYNWMSAQQRLARQSANDLSKCRLLADEIQSLRKAPTLASATDMGFQELAKRVEQASAQSGIRSDVLEGVFPMSPRRVGNSPYMLKPTRVTLRNLSMSQLSSFLFYLTQDSPLAVRDLRLSVPRGDIADDVWDAEAVLTYLIYSPQPKKSSN